MDRMAPEMLLAIFDYVGGPDQPETRLHEQPTSSSLSAGNTPLKAASLVCRTWRSLALQFLFRHVVWKPDAHPPATSNKPPLELLLPQLKPLLRFLAENNLDRRVITFTMSVDSDRPLFNSSEELLTTTRPCRLAEIWHSLFSIIDPLRSTIVARPTALIGLLSLTPFPDRPYQPDPEPCNMLSLARANREEPSISVASSVSSSGSHLFGVRPWTSLILNEGSFMNQPLDYLYSRRGYSRTLPGLLLSQFPKTVADFSYIAIYSPPSHWIALTRNLPRINRLFLQFTPMSACRISEYTIEMKNDDDSLRQSTWVCYRSLAKILTQSPLTEPNSSWRQLSVLESGGAYLRVTWDQFEEYFKQHATKDWKLEREGVFVIYSNDG
ncbi:hypothetical protein F5B21DRAFT_217895 [Xylaria acuta]|nr:hypothetical protein F5B21DRAFT_217895 [Xylaria acuta]